MLHKMEHRVSLAQVGEWMYNSYILHSWSWAKQWGFQLKTTGMETNMSIKPQTCKYCTLVCKQTQQAFLEYESITVDLNWMCEGGGDYLSVVFPHFIYRGMQACLLGSLWPMQWGNCLTEECITGMGKAEMILNLPCK